MLPIALLIPAPIGTAAPPLTAPESAVLPGAKARSRQSAYSLDIGRAHGGTIMYSRRYGNYPAFPEEILAQFESQPSQQQTRLISGTKIAEIFSVSPQNINAVLSELGWITKGQIKGWVVTKAGEKLGAIQKIYDKTGVPYVMWPKEILDIPSFVQSIQEYKGESSIVPNVEVEIIGGFREKFEAKHRAQDGHFVRSRAELIIDNWLYMAEVSHAYERKLPIQENVYSDFYLPSGKVYIEFWGMESNPSYADRKKDKISVYRKYDFNLIELRDEDVHNIDDILPGLLLKFGVRSY